MEEQGAAKILLQNAPQKKRSQRKEQVCLHMVNKTAMIARRKHNTRV